MNWTEGDVHVAMRSFLKSCGWNLVAGEFPGGSDHELYPLNVVDPELARDQSPDPRRHSLGELIPDLVALKNDEMLLIEAKVGYSQSDKLKLMEMLTERKHHLIQALEKFAKDRGFNELLPVERLNFYPVLAFCDGAEAPPVEHKFSYLRITDRKSGYFEGQLNRIMIL